MSENIETNKSTEAPKKRRRARTMSSESIMNPFLREMLGKEITPKVEEMYKKPAVLTSSEPKPVAKRGRREMPSLTKVPYIKKLGKQFLFIAKLKRMLQA